MLAGSEVVPAVEVGSAVGQVLANVRSVNSRGVFGPSLRSRESGGRVAGGSGAPMPRRGRGAAKSPNVRNVLP